MSGDHSSLSVIVNQRVESPCDSKHERLAGSKSSSQHRDWLYQWWEYNLCTTWVQCTAPQHNTPEYA